jgi:hypothetical protein
VSNILPDIFNPPAEAPVLLPAQDDILGQDLVLVAKIPLIIPEKQKLPKKRKSSKPKKKVKLKRLPEIPICESEFLSDLAETTDNVTSMQKIRDKSKYLVLNQSEIDDIASVKEISKSEIRKNKIPLSEKYLIDCAKEKLTGKQSTISNSEISVNTLGRYICKECDKVNTSVFRRGIFPLLSFFKCNHSHSAS